MSYHSILGVILKDSIIMYELVVYPFNLLHESSLIEERYTIIRYSTIVSRGGQDGKI